MDAIPFAVPDIGVEEIAAVTRVMEQGWITSGAEMKAFEDDLKNFTGAPHVIAVNSATAGLHLALLAAGVGPGDKVLVPTLTFAATAEVVKAVGATVVLYDTELEYLSSDVMNLDKFWDHTIKFALVVSFAGQPLAMDAIVDWARGAGVTIIEDAAHTFGTAYRNSRLQVGSHPGVFATVFSFYATKVITTGEGGAVCVNSAEAAKTIRTLRLHGIDRDAFDRYTSKSSGWEYDVVVPGWKYNMTDTAAAMGRVQLQRHEDMTARRKQIKNEYILLGGMTQYSTKDHVAHLFVMYGLRDREGFFQKMKDQGVSCSVHFKPLHRMTAYARTARVFPNAERYWEGCISLPIFSKMTDEQVQRVMDAARIARGQKRIAA